MLRCTPSGDRGLLKVHHWRTPSGWSRAWPCRCLHGVLFDVLDDSPRNKSIERANTLEPIEIKSGQTITPEYFKGIQYWVKLSGQAGGTVLYGGESPQYRSDGISVLSWRKVKDFL